MNKRYIYCLLIVLVLFPISAGAYDITVRVVDKAPWVCEIQGCEEVNSQLRLYDSSGKLVQRTRSSARGDGLFSGITSGEYTLVVDAGRYQTVTYNLNVQDADQYIILRMVLK